MRLDREWSPSLRSEIKEYIEERGEAFAESPRGVMKRDTNTTDFLVETSPRGRVSAMLDWEQVYIGYVLFDCVVAYLRIRGVGRLDLWVDFCAEYEAETGKPLVQDRAIEYCLMCWCWLAPVPAWDDLILSLVNGQRIPFAKRD